MSINNLTIMENINNLTGFMNGLKFESDIEVLEYFSIENMNDMFGKCYKSNLTQKQLDNFANFVIENKIHYK